jgi:hypothetical protein
MTAAIETVPLPLVAYVVNTGIAMPLVCATRARTWMEETTERFANRCLPLLMANQAGWFLLSAHTVRVTWLGTNELSGVRVELLKGAPPHPVLSHFGHGVVTFNVPYLFRTPPGYNLLVRGPANWPKDGATPLEGLVESDWSAATFTLNWRLTRPHHPVTFEQGEPIGMLVPQRRSELEMFQPEMRMIDSAPEIRDRYQSWSRSRADFNAALAVPGSGAAKQRWQKDYFRGSVGNGATSDQHQTKLTLREFANHGVPLPPPVPVDRGPRRTPVGRVPASRSADELLEDLIVEESFLGPQVCQALVETHKKFGRLGPTSDNGYPLARTRHDNPAQFEIVRSLIRRLSGLIAERYHDKVGCDLALLCAIIPGFCHTLHADNARVTCPRHGDDAEALVRANCQCEDIEVRPNHTAWRRYSALVYLSEQHRGGDIVFGEGPNIYGGKFRKQIQVRRGMLVLSPSNELYHHLTTPVESGIRYSMNVWFSSDPAHVAAEWR